MIKNIVLHGATNCNSSNYGDFLYGEIIYNYLKRKNMNVVFYQPSNFFIEHLKDYPSQIPENSRQKPDLILYIPGGYFGEGHNARIRDNIIQFFRFMPLGMSAAARDIPLAVLGVGAGPNNSMLMNYGIKKICNHALFVTTRDNTSHNALLKLSPKANIIQSADLILTRDWRDFGTTPQINSIINNNDDKYMLIHYNHSREALLKFGGAVQKFIKLHPEYKIIVSSDSIMSSEDENYNAFSNLLSGLCEHFIYSNSRELTQLINKVDVVLTCKLHVGVVAATLKKSVVSVACHPEKTKRFYSQIGEEERCISLYKATTNTIIEMLERYHEREIHIPQEVIMQANVTWELLDSIL